MRLGRRGNETRLIIQSGTLQRPVDQKLLNLISRDSLGERSFHPARRNPHQALGTVTASQDRMYPA